MDVSLPAPGKPAEMMGVEDPVAAAPKAIVACLVNALATTVYQVATVNHAEAMGAEALVVSAPEEQSAALQEPAWMVPPPTMTAGHHPIQPTRSLAAMGAGAPLLAVIAVCPWGYPSRYWQS